MDFDDLGFDDDSSEESEDGDLDLFGDKKDESEDEDIADEEESEDGNKHSVLKTSLIAIGCGIVLIFVVFLVVNLIRNSEKEPKDKSYSTVDTDYSQNEAVYNQSEESKAIQNNSNNSDSVKVNDGWTEVNLSNLDKSGQVIELDFTVTDKKDFVHIGENIQAKTTLYGGISGMSGVYQLDVPISYGLKISVGDIFKVKVNLYEMEGKKIISIFD